MTSLVAKVVAVHASLEAAQVEHAFGGALALAYCTGAPRATADIDVNVFVEPERAEWVLAALPDGVRHRRGDADAARRDGQVRVWWGETPVDLFFEYHELHERARRRVRVVPFGDQHIPVLACADLATFKALFDRTRDWADIEAMAAADTFDVAEVRAALGELLGEADRRLSRLAAAVDAAEQYDESPPGLGPPPTHGADLP